MPTTAPDAVIEEQATQTARAEYFVDLEFAHGSVTPDESAKSSLESLVKRARAEAPLSDVKILAWADEEYPTAKRKKLSSAAQKLATGRARSIADLLKTYAPGVKTQPHSMAVRPGVFSRWFNTADARFKKTLVAAGLPVSDEVEPTLGRASHALVLVTLK